MVKIQIKQGHVLEVLKGMAAESVHCVITSPPYWGLRDYGIEPQVWGGVEGCEHEWEEKSRYWDNRAGSLMRDEGTADFSGKKDTRGHIKSSFCTLCSAWRGSYGLEPTIELYVAHTIEIFREVRRVLRKDGCVFCNLGDSYSGSGEGGGGNRKGNEHGQHDSMVGKRGKSGLKPKDLCGVPWRVALALQADGWWLRSDIIWSKPNPMPESVTDRPTRSHEYIFLLTKSGRYFWDAEAVRENSEPSSIIHGQKYGELPEVNPSKGNYRGDGNYRGKQCGFAPGRAMRNLRSVWTIATAPFPGAHFATFPPALVERCIRAGTSEHGVCGACGAPWKRVVEKNTPKDYRGKEIRWGNQEGNANRMPDKFNTESTTLCWQPTCTCPDPAPVPATVLDIFGGAGTVGLVAGKMGRNAVLIELKPEYAEMARTRIKGSLGLLGVVG